jgi:hypothetical protein
MKKKTQWSCLYETNKFMERNLTWEKGRRWFLFLFLFSFTIIFAFQEFWEDIDGGVCIRRGVVRSMAVSFCSCLFVSNRIAFDNNNVTQTVPIPPQSFFSLRTVTLANCCCRFFFLFAGRGFV